MDWSVTWSDFRGRLHGWPIHFTWRLAASRLCELGWIGLDARGSMRHGREQYVAVLCLYGGFVALPYRTRSEATSPCVRPLLRIVGPVSVHQLFGPIHSGNGHAVDLGKGHRPAPTCCQLRVDRGVRVDSAVWLC